MSARDWIKLGIATATESTGVGHAWRTLRTAARGPRIHVLGYHRVVDAIDPRGAVNPSLCITTDRFRRQMEQLRERFIVLPLSYAIRAVTGEIVLPHDAVAVTFNDGYRDVLLRAAPILRALDIPATVFVPTGFAGAPGRDAFLPHDRLYAASWAARRTGHGFGGLGDTETALLLSRADRVLAARGPAGVVEDFVGTVPGSTIARVIEILEDAFGAAALDDGARVLAPEEVRALAERGWDVGAHTIGHVVLTHESMAEQTRQLAEPKATLEAWSGHPCRYFAYCNGYHSPALVACLRRVGYEGAVTTCDRPNPVGGGDPYRITRKVLWDAHALGPDGAFSPAVSAANLHDTFGLLGLTTPVDGSVDQPEEPQTHEDQLDPEPTTEVEIAY